MKKKEYMKSLEVMSLISLGFFFKVTDYLHFYQRQNFFERNLIYISWKLTKCNIKSNFINRTWPWKLKKAFGKVENTKDQVRLVILLHAEFQNSKICFHFELEQRQFFILLETNI